MNILKKYLEEKKVSKEESIMEFCLESSKSANDFIRCCKLKGVNMSNDEMVDKFREYNNPDCKDRNKSRRRLGKNRRG